MDETRLVLDIGCGKNKVKGAIGIDINRWSDADIICDIEVGLPFRHNIFDEIHCNHIIEHVSDLIKLMEEIHRVSKNGAKVYIRAPYYASFLAFSDPTHKKFITEQTFDMFTEERSGYYTNAKFKIIKIDYKYSKIVKIFY